MIRTTTKKVSKGSLVGYSEKKVGQNWSRIGIGNFFCIGLDSKYFCVYGHTVYVPAIQHVLIKLYLKKQEKSRICPMGHSLLNFGLEHQEKTIKIQDTYPINIQLH